MIEYTALFILKSLLTRQYHITYVMYILFIFDSMLVLMITNMGIA